jgi:hypothetical protein
MLTHHGPGSAILSRCSFGSNAWLPHSPETELKSMRRREFVALIGQPRDFKVLASIVKSDVHFVILLSDLSIAIL